jgi:hypothetical protein
MMKTYTAFAEDMWLATGTREEVAATLRTMPDMQRASDLLVFDDEDGRQIDFDLRETPPAEEAPRPRGRPSLGVVAREVTLLPRHWDWLGEQPGGASRATAPPAATPPTASSPPSPATGRIMRRRSAPSMPMTAPASRR